MSQRVQEFVDSRGLALRIDRPSGVIRGVKILGLASRNGRRYLPEALARAAALYEGAKVNVNHAKGHPAGPRDYQDRIGTIRGVAVRPDEGLFADFHFNPKHALAEQLLWDAAHAPENVGFSHNVEARLARRGDQTVVEAITRVESVDLVADPATTRGLFEAAGADVLPDAPVRPPGLGGLSVEALRRHRPDLVESIEAEAAAECQSLRQEVERLRGQSADYRRRETVRRLLREHHLPEPDDDGPLARAITGPAFVEALLGAESEEAIRAMVEERARLVHALRPRAAWGDGRPTARDQRLVEPAGPADTDSFVRAITR
jgi:hypothetical protein